MLRYLSDLPLEYPGADVRQYLVYIGREPSRRADGLRLPNLDYRYTLLDMQKVDCETLLRQDSPDAWVLAALCDFHRRQPRAVIHEILTRLLQRFPAQSQTLREYLSMLEILSDNRDLNLDIREEFDMLAINLEKLPSYEMGRAEGAREQAMATASAPLAEGKEPAWISRITGLSQAEVERLKESPKSSACD